MRVRAAMKPIATVPRALATVDIVTGEAAQVHLRTDAVALDALGQGERFLRNLIEAYAS